MLVWLMSTACATSLLFPNFVGRSIVLPYTQRWITNSDSLPSGQKNLSKFATNHLRAITRSLAKRQIVFYKKEAFRVCLSFSKLALPTIANHVDLQFYDWWAVCKMLVFLLTSQESLLFKFVSVSWIRLGIGASQSIIWEIKMRHEIRKSKVWNPLDSIQTLDF